LLEALHFAVEPTPHIQLREAASLFDCEPIKSPHLRKLMRLVGIEGFQPVHGYSGFIWPVWAQPEIRTVSGTVFLDHTRLDVADDVIRGGQVVSLHA
jgi:hypothetical protein